MARISHKLRQEVKERAKGICEYCRSNSAYFLPDMDLEVDHIIPSSKSGKNAAENLAFCCPNCNVNKSDKTEGVDPISQKTVRLFHPRNEDWYEHFAWSEDYTLVIGLTQIGRATVEVLDLNRSGLISQRGILHSRGEHPPE